MGMFDYIKCKYPLPLEGANDREYQTKDTPSQVMDLYEIREDGTLWVEEYDIDDQSKVGAWLAANPGKEIPSGMFQIEDYFGMLSQTHKRWKQVDITDVVKFYDFVNIEKDYEFLTWEAVFIKGKLVHLERTLK